jgi:hypothetical protein
MLISLPILVLMDCRKLQAEYERVSREVEVHRLKEEREALMRKRDMLLKQQREDVFLRVGCRYQVVLPMCRVHTGPLNPFTLFQAAMQEQHRKKEEQRRARAQEQDQKVCNSFVLQLAMRHHHL